MTQANKSLLGKLLLLSLIVILIQVMIGGITRLTGSGLSITDWNIITGTMPPLSEMQWNIEFDQYKATPQYQKLNEGMSMSDFKFIFFWEWFHRFWGRIGFVFLLSIFGFFAFKKRLDKPNVWRFGILLFLYFCQGLLGWWMVASGLINNPYVSHYRLTAHLLAATFLFAFIVWWTVDLLVPPEKRQPVEAQFRQHAWIATVLIIVQIVFGAFMSGLKIAGRYPTWPDMNGQMIPDNLFYMSPFLQNFVENPATIQFVHRGLAYLLTVLLLIYFFKAFKLKHANEWFRNLTLLLPVILLTQIALGILTVLSGSGDTVSVGLGAAHQITGLLLLSTVLFLNFQLVVRR